MVLGRTLGAGFPWGRQLAAMAAGMYTGGSPNFNAIGVILGVPGDTIAIGNLSDMIVGTVFYIFILTLAKPLCAKVLDRHAKQGAYMRENGGAENVDTLEWNGFHRGIVRNLALSLACVLVGAVIGFTIWKVKGGALTDPLVPAVMIAGTTLGLALSFVPKVRNVKENSAAGHYLILVFSFALASSLDLGTLGGNLLHTVALLASITVCSALLHLLLCRIFRIGADCAIVTMTAGLYGPAFIPAVTKQLRCDALTAARSATPSARSSARRSSGYYKLYRPAALLFGKPPVCCLAESAPAGANEVRLKTFLPATCGVGKNTYRLASVAGGAIALRRAAAPQTPPSTE